MSRFLALLAGTLLAVLTARAQERPRVLDREPRPTLTVPPVYPDSLRAAGIGGRVFVRVHVALTGEVAEAEVLQGLHPVLDAHAVAAVRRWRFYPAAADGRLVDAWITVPVRFRAGPPLVADDPPGLTPRPEGPPLLTFGPGLRANPDGCTDASAPQPQRYPMPNFISVRDAAWDVGHVEMVTQIWFEVDARGRVASVVLMESQGYSKAIRAFERATREGVQGWRFAPATCDGRPVPSWFLMPMRYRQ